MVEAMSVRPADTTGGTVSKQFSEILARPKVKTILQQELIEPIAMSPQELTTFIQREINAWAPIVDTAGLRK